MGPEEAGAVVGPEEAEELAVAVVAAGPAEAVDMGVVVGPEEAEELAVAVVPAGPAVDVGVEVGQAEVAAARGVAVGALPVAWEVLTGITPAPLLSATTRWLPNRILIARRTASGP